MALRRFFSLVLLVGATVRGVEFGGVSVDPAVGAVVAVMVRRRNMRRRLRSG